MKGLLVDVYRKNGMDCTNNGVTSQFDTLLLVGEGVPEVFEDRGVYPVVKIKKQDFGFDVRVCAEPIEKDGSKTNYMFGGNFIYSSDSRFGKLNNSSPIRVDDRQETWDQYESLSK